MVQVIDDARRRPASGGRVPPHNIEAEESLLGAMLLSKDAIAAAVETASVRTTSTSPPTAHLFEAIYSLYGAGEPVDPVTVAEELRRADLLEALGGKATLLRIQAGTPAAANAAHYARIVEEHALLRRLIGVAGEIAEMGYDVPDDVTNTLDRAETLVFEVAKRRLSDVAEGHLPGAAGHPRPARGAVRATPTLTGVPSGYIDLDEMLLGLQPSNLDRGGARPGQGKTAFALGAATHVALETPQAGRLLLDGDGLPRADPADAGRRGAASTPASCGPAASPSTTGTKISHAVGRLAEAPFFIDDNPHCTVMEMRAKARRTKAPPRRPRPRRRRLPPADECERRGASPRTARSRSPSSPAA